jgi:hypothetical protein
MLLIILFFGALALYGLGLLGIGLLWLLGIR